MLYVLQGCWREEAPRLANHWRYDWKLPKRKGGGTSAITLHAKPGDALIATHKELEGITRTGLMQTLAKAVQALAQKDALTVETIGQFKDACLAATKLFGWDGKPQAEININNQVRVVCTEEQRQRLIALANSSSSKELASQWGRWLALVLRARARNRLILRNPNLGRAGQAGASQYYVTEHRADR